eukprot:superscaffoldBa00000594_g5895
MPASQRLHKLAQRTKEGLIEGCSFSILLPPQGRFQLPCLHRIIDGHLEMPFMLCPVQLLLCPVQLLLCPVQLLQLYICRLHLPQDSQMLLFRFPLSGQ